MATVADPRYVTQTSDRRLSVCGCAHCHSTDKNSTLSTQSTLLTTREEALPSPDCTAEIFRPVPCHTLY
ncbi:hypothetical protein E2C01_097962 [Portunus trituberculatus]|uniref:Uncharacterized protein n=1 Tax=Portunus trituberculatus TaxID=210409 RepID=A0A5B7K708_PORTR|nr:hypothetical protein [Portunus trituberculatus]